MNNENGVLTISIEIELAWGLKEKGDYLGLSKDRKNETRALERIINLCEMKEVPITFDFIGHLLLKECEDDHYHGHPEGWFDEDPCTKVEDDPLWYAPDLLDKIKESYIDHELATHTFSHIWVDEVKPEVLKWELDKVREIHDDLDIEGPVSLVTPQNRIPNYTPLKESGIKVLRRCPEDRITNSKLKMLWNDLFSRSPQRKPVIKNGVLETYGDHRATLTGNYLPHGRMKPHIFYRMLPFSNEYWVQRHEKKLKDELMETIDNNSYIHLWSHLWEMSNRWQMRIFEDFIKFVDDKKKEGLKVKTMKELWDDLC